MVALSRKKRIELISKEIELLALGVAKIMSNDDIATYKLLRKIDYLLDVIHDERGFPALKFELNEKESLI
jgi:hypothetical protein